MALRPGLRLGSYEIVRAIGAGGMGEVYEARDVRLDRRVAIKVLGDDLASHSVARERFQREAKVISQLQHPHICALYDVGTHEGHDYLVLEYLEGETLAARISRGPLPVHEIVAIARQMASALDAAHRHGIIHRDLKPGNVMVMRGTTVKLLDFGLAKETRGPVGSTDETRTPAEGTARPLTAEGAILGTFQYMSPEQIEGGTIDGRSDIWALGCVVYEMATGERPFQGRTAASIMGSVLKEEPPLISSKQPLSPTSLDQIVGTCLAKDPDARFSSAHDAALALSFVATRSSASGIQAAALPRGRSRWKTSVAAVGGIAALVAVAAGAYFAGAARSGSAPSVSLELSPPEGMAFNDAPSASPDGRSLVFQSGGRLWLRRLETPVAISLPGSEDGAYPFWSPDSRSIVFAASKQLLRLDLNARAPVRICSVSDFRGGAWLDDDTVIFAGEIEGPLLRVPISGGTPAPFTTLDKSRNEISHRFPLALPNGRFLYQVTTNQVTEFGIWTASVARPQDRVEVLKVPSTAMYAQGFLVFWRDGAVLAQPFDAATGQLSASPSVVAERVPTSEITNRGAFAVSPAGTIAFRVERPPLRQLEFVNLKGEVVSKLASERVGNSLELSPTGDRLAMTVGTAITIIDIARGDEHRLFDGPDATGGEPRWFPDGKQLLFASPGPAGPDNLFRAAVEGGGRTAAVPHTPGFMRPYGVRSNGTIVYQQLNTTTGSDELLTFAPGRETPVVIRVLGTTPGTGRVSRDGRWLAYGQIVDNRWQVIVRDLENTGVARQVSVAGGWAPRWSADGRELYYVDLADMLMAVDVRTTPVLSIGSPRPLFRSGLHEDLCAGICYDVKPDGTGFLLNRLTQLPQASLQIITNWTGPAGVH